MITVARQTMLRVAVLTVMSLTSLAVSRAGVIQSTVELPPVSGAYTLGGLCLSVLGRCTQNAMVSGFEVLERTVENDNELVVVSATYSADIFTDNGGVPGAFLGHLSLLGRATFTYLGRDPSVNPLGTFTTQLTNFVFQGMLNGNTFEVKHDPEKTSTGSTTILPATFVTPVTYAVSGSLEILAFYSFRERFHGGPAADGRSDSHTGADPGARYGRSCRVYPDRYCRYCVTSSPASLDSRLIRRS